MMPLGLSVACGIYFGNSLGEGKPRLAMQYYRVCLFLALIVTFLQILGLYFGINQVIAIFTEQESIAKIMKVAWPMLLVYTFFDTLQIMGGTVMRSTLNQKEGTGLNFVGYFLFGIPISIYFAFKEDLGVKGIWVGPAFAVAFLTLTYNLFISKINWVSIVDTLEERTRIENEEREKLELKKKIETETLDDYDDYTAL